MSVFKLNDNTFVASKQEKILYDYPTITIQKSEIKGPHNISSQNYFSIPYINQTSTPNFEYTPINATTPETYAVKKIYFFGLLHNNIQDVTTGRDSDPNIIGELVIEHNSITTRKVLYTCHLLKKYNPGQTQLGTDIDTVIDLMDADAINASIILNSSISKAIKYIVYEDGPGKLIMINTNPIMIVDNTTAFVSTYDTKTTLFGINAPNVYKIIDGINITIRKEEDIYIDCKPTGVSDEEVSTYNIPLLSETSNQKQNLDFMKMTVNFVIFIVILIVASFGIPILYKAVVINKVIQLVGLAENSENVKLGHIRIKTIDVFIFLFFALLILVIFGYGKENGDYNSFMVCLFLSVFYILSSVLISVKKQDEKYMTFDKKNLSYPIDKDGDKDDNLINSIIQYISVSDIGQFLGETVNLFIKNVSTIFGFELIYFIIILSLGLTNQFSPNKKINQNLAIMFGLRGGIMLIFLILIFAVVFKKNNRIVPV
uniref:Uncharacterized protein n=1 Tax=viral metagenome TaxID=1070528 RepID=A0A6C0EDI4_9ZZZZ